MKLKRKHILGMVGLLLCIGIYSISYSDIPLEELHAKYTTQESKFIAINGMNVHYKDEGEGPVIVLIHGTAASLHTWDAWAAVLQKTHRVIRMDIPAFGLTGPHPTGDYSIDSYVSFLAAFFEALSLKKVLLIGNSLGGNIAWQFTAKYPAQVDRLVLVDASGLPTGKAQPWIFSMARTPVINRLFLRITPKAIVKQNLTQVYEDDS